MSQARSYSSRLVLDKHVILKQKHWKFAPAEKSRLRSWATLRYFLRVFQLLERELSQRTMDAGRRICTAKRWVSSMSFNCFSELFSCFRAACRWNLLWFCASEIGQLKEFFWGRARGISLLKLLADSFKLHLMMISKVSLGGDGAILVSRRWWSQWIVSWKGGILRNFVMNFLLLWLTKFSLKVAVKIFILEF